MKYEDLSSTCKWLQREITFNSCAPVPPLVPAAVPVSGMETQISLWEWPLLHHFGEACLVWMCPPTWEQNVPGPEATTKPTLISHNDTGEVGGIKMLWRNSNEPLMPKTPWNEVRRHSQSFWFFLPENDVNTEVFPAKRFQFNRTVFWTPNHCLETFFWPATLLVDAVGGSVLVHS